MKTRTGDLIALAQAGDFDVIVHGCNCFCNMGAGIARAIRAAFPQAYAADLATAKGDPRKLGTISCAAIPDAAHPLTVVNAYTQFHYAGPGPLADLNAISNAFVTIATQFDGQRIGYPMIGAGLAGGDWAEIAPRIDSALAGQDHTLVVLP